MFLERGDVIVLLCRQAEQQWSINNNTGNFVCLGGQANEHISHRGGFEGLSPGQ